jgi:hypothetical protein
MFRMSAGADLVARITAEMRENGLEPDAKETELLAVAEGLQNRLADLERDIEEDGRSMVLTSGRIVMNPAVAESRMTRTSLATVLTKISMSEAPAKDPVKQAASRTRWREHNLAKAQRLG